MNNDLSTEAKVNAGETGLPKKFTVPRPKIPPDVMAAHIPASASSAGVLTAPV